MLFLSTLPYIKLKPDNIRVHKLRTFVNHYFCLRLQRTTPPISLQLPAQFAYELSSEHAAQEQTHIHLTSPKTTPLVLLYTQAITTTVDSIGVGHNLHL